MDVLKEIIQQSAIGPYNIWSKSLVLTLFSSIVITLVLMLLALVLNVPNSIQFGY